MLKKLCQCIGLAAIILVMQYGDLLGGGADVRMHVPFALNGIIFAELADILILGVILFAIIAPLSRTRYHSAVCLVLAVLVPPYLVERTRAAFPLPVTNIAVVLFAIAWVIFVFVLVTRYASAYQKLIRLGDFIGIFFAVFALGSIVQMLYLTRWKPGPFQQAAAWASTPQPPRHHPLIVWIVFDELSYDQVYGHRAAGLALPNFDALRSQSTVFSNARPIGDRTVKVIPSLFSGHIVDEYRFSFHNRLRVHYAEAHGFHNFSGAQTIFADAEQQGWRTAAVGWYNPYCSLYASAIQDCYWTNHDKFDAPMAQDASFWKNTWLPLKVVGVALVRPDKANDFLCTFDVRQRYKTYADLELHTSQLLRADQADFVYLHLPVPHSPNIWDRKTNSFTRQCGASYLDNVALTDIELGKIITTLEASPRWNDTTLIVEGDHSWRTYLWEGQPSWTNADETASSSGFDPRPAMIIHQPGQTQPQTITTPWSILNIHTVLEQIVHNRPIHL